MCNNDPVQLTIRQGCQFYKLQPVSDPVQGDCDATATLPSPQKLPPRLSSLEITVSLVF